MAKPMTTKDKIREWISDNLRYMLLIGAILLIVAAVLLIVHMVSSRSDNGKSNAAVTTSSSQNDNSDNRGVSDKKTQVKAESSTAADSTADTNSENKENTDTSDNTGNTDNASGDETQESGQQPMAGAESTFAADNVPEVSAVLQQYYTALGGKDIAEIRQLTDAMTDEEQAQIEAETDVESYEEVQTYTVSGPAEGTYVAFVNSKCKYQGIETTLPMLSEYYLYQTEDGSLKIMDDTDSDAAASEAMKSALDTEDVKNLIDQVQKDYQNALDADAALRAYVESLQ